MARTTSRTHSRGMPRPSLLCRIGVHHWQTLQNDDGEDYLSCERCHKEGDKIHLADYRDPGADT